MMSEDKLNEYFRLAVDQWELYLGSVIPVSEVIPIMELFLFHSPEIVDFMPMRKFFVLVRKRHRELQAVEDVVGNSPPMFTSEEDVDNTEEIVYVIQDDEEESESEQIHLTPSWMDKFFSD